jgi:outer membrane protein
MNHPYKTIVILILPLLVFSNSVIYAQQENQISSFSSGDSLSLNEIIKEVIDSHPSIKEAEEALNAADARINLARTGYNPEIDLAANYSLVGPVIELNIPNMGTFQLFPENNYSASVNYRQVIYDFGRTYQNVALENENKDMIGTAVEQVKQKMALAVINNFYTLLYLQEAIVIKEEQLETLKEHLSSVEKMRATGSATDYHVLSTQVKLSAVESQKFDLEAAFTAQTSFLNSLLGISDNPPHLIKKELRVDPGMLTQDSLLSYALKNRDEIILSEKKSLIAGLKYDLIKTQNKPMLSFMASGGAKNGYVPYLNRIKPNYAVGVGLKVPLFDGNKMKYNLMQMESSINTLSYESEVLKRNISKEVIEDKEYINAANQRVSQFELQLAQALKAYSMAETNFRSGAITNLDLLDSNTAVSECRLMLLKARIDYATSILRLDAALGERLY